MATKRVGSYTVKFKTPPVITGWASVVGKKEGEGPLADTFDFINTDTTFGEKTWEKAESAMQKDTLARALGKASLTAKDVQYLFCGDLLNQCISSFFAHRDSDIPLVGLYGACSTMAESLAMASVMIDGGFADIAGAVTSSHFCTAERQYRFPLEYGGQRTPSAQWTVTGSGACILASAGKGPRVTHVTVGRICDYGITDANNMGAAMAPAAYQTLGAFFSDTGTKPEEYDLIVTGDLGKIGRDIVRELFEADGVKLPTYDDCGTMVFDASQDVHAGGSGCGCSAAVLCGYILGAMQKGLFKKVLFAGTGALMSTVSSQQNESIPGVCHLVCIEQG